MDFSLLQRLTTEENYLIGGRSFARFSVLMSICEIEGIAHFLLEKRAAGIRQGGEISFPGGAMEPQDKNPGETALRETLEELRLPPGDVRLLGKYGAQLTPFGSVIYCYLGLLHIRDLSSVQPDPAEVERLITVPLDFFADTPPRREKIRIVNTPSDYMKTSNIPDHYHEPWGGFARDVFFWEYEGDVIWGLTAGIIHDFTERLKNLGGK